MTPRRIWTATGVIVVSVGLAVAARQAGPDDRLVEWRYYSGDNAATKYSPLDQIAKDNVSSLAIAWRRPHLDPAVAALLPPNFRLTNNYRATPIMIGGVLYVSNAIGLVEAFDAETGRTIWVQKPGGEEVRGGTSNRGVAYWRGGGGDERLFSFRGHSLFALNPKTGEPIPGFGRDGAVDLNDGLDTSLGQWHWASAPLVVRDVVVMGSAMAEQDSATRREGQPGDVRGYDVRTGKLRWTFHVVPRDGEDAVATWADQSWRYTGAGNVWALMSADEELGYVYLPTTSVTNDMYGGHRRGDNLFSDCIVCIDARTGRRVWHYQTVHHDLFDYDNPAAPILADFTVGGKKIKAVVQITKQSFAYVLDRTTGKPVWPIEERPVPQSDVPGEQTSPTQPFPTKPPPFDRQGISDDDLIDFTPELRAQARALVKQFRHGPLFTPPSVVSNDPGGTQGTIQLSGSVGGADWTGAAFDPDTGMLYVPSMTNPFVANLVPGKPEETNLRYRAGDRRLIQLPNGLPLTKPPYGRITAIDLNRGDQVWTVPNGDGPRNHPLLKGLELPPLGQAVRAAPLVTKTLLFVTEGDQISVRTPPGGGGNKIRAYDKATGAIVWEHRMDAGSTGTLMTYMFKGRQYIVVAIGGQQHPAELIAFALGGAKPVSAGDRANVNWPLHNLDLAGSRYSTIDQINTRNVKLLAPRWLFQYGIIDGVSNQTTPVIVDGKMYVTDPRGSVYALDAADGHLLWSFDVTNQIGGGRQEGYIFRNRGVCYADGVVYTAAGSFLFALDATSGKPIPTFGTKGQAAVILDVVRQRFPDVQSAITLGYWFTTAPQIHNGVIYIGSTRSESHIPGGHVLAIDAKSGKVLWHFNTIPQDERDQGWTIAGPTWVGGERNGGGIWETPSIDPELGLVYVAVGNPFGDSTKRAGMNLFTDSVLALALDTGTLKWYVQQTHHDVWDYDSGQQPILFDMNVKGQRVKALAQASKNGFLYILNRESGKPVHPIVESPVPTETDRPGEQPWPTQPIPHTANGKPTVPVSPVVAEDIPAAQLARFKIAPMFTPLSRDLIHAPGTGGGANYGALSYSPRTGFLYVNAIDQPTNAGRGAKGYFSAYDPTTGELAWRQVFEGWGQAGSVVTAGDVVLVGSGSNIAGYFLAYNAKTGEPLWKFNTGAGIFSSPSTYMVNGEQFVTVGSGGGDRGRRGGDLILSFALPKQ